VLLDELLVGLGYDYEDKDLKKFKADVAATVNIVKRLATAAAAGATALFGMVTASTAASDAQGKLANEIGISVGELDALQFALGRSGGSAAGMASSLQNLSIRAAEAARGIGSGVEAFSMLGVSTRRADGSIKSASQLMIEISGAMQGLDKSRQLELADKLGLRDSIRLLQQGPAAIRELTAEAHALGTTTGEDAALAAEFQDALLDVWRVVKQVTRVIVRELAPAMTGIATAFKEWWIANRDIIEQNIPVYIEKATAALKLLAFAVGTLLAYRLATHLIQMIALMRSLGLATLFMNAAALALPLLITAVITAIGLLIQDIMVFARGGDSFFGDLLEKFPLLKTALTAIGDLFKRVGDFISATWEKWQEFTSWIKGNEGGIAVGPDTAPTAALPAGADPRQVRGGRFLERQGTVQNNTIEITVMGSGNPEETARATARTIEEQKAELESRVDS